MLHERFQISHAYEPRGPKLWELPAQGRGRKAAKIGTRRPKFLHPVSRSTILHLSFTHYYLVPENALSTDRN